MSSSTSTSLDLTPKGLFPTIDDANKDSKCLLISKVIQQIAEKATMSPLTMSTLTQEKLQRNALERYIFLSEEDRLLLPIADQKASLLCGKGVSEETAREYFSVRLTPEDAKMWVVITPLEIGMKIGAFK